MLGGNARGVAGTTSRGRGTLVAAQLAVSAVLSSAMLLVRCVFTFGVYGVLAAVALFAVALCAAAVPAWRASRLDPQVAIRSGG